MNSPRIGWKDVVFVGLCLAGAATFVGAMLRRDRVTTPRDFQPLRFVSATPASDPADPRAVRDRIDADFRALWQKKQLQPTDRADDLQIARRISLALTGVVPSVEEVRSLEEVPERERVEWWVSHLLEDRRYADYVAERFARVVVGTEDGPFLRYRRRRFVSWLSDQLHENKPYDQIVRGLIADHGLWTSTPAVNFISVTTTEANGEQPNEIPLAGRTARAFLGLRIDCLECHDDKLGTVTLGNEQDSHAGTQQNFHELAAFFGQAESSLTGIRDNDDLKYEYRYLGHEAKEVVAASVPFNDQCLSGHGTLREQLATWVTHPQNRPFARVTVNRVWALLFGRPLVEPIDSIPLHGPWPATMEILADDFIAHGHDLKRLIRIITASEVFQRDSAADFEITRHHDENFASFPLTRLRPEQVASSLVQSACLQTIDADAHILRQLDLFSKTRDFTQRYGDPGSDEFTDRGGTITQRLLMMNGELVRERTGENIVFNASTRLAAVCPDNAKAIEAVYLAVLTRRPSEEERSLFVERFGTRQGDFRRAPIEDLYWILINSTEFSWNH